MGGGSKPKVASDNLFSQDMVELSYGFGQGTIWGLVDGLKSFYAGGTPIIAQDGETNFEDFALNFRLGYQDDVPINYLLRGEGSIISGTANIPLPPETAKSYTTQPALRGKINFIDVRLLIQQLYTGNSDGDVSSSIIAFEIKYRPVGDPTWRYFTRSTTDQYIDKLLVAALRQEAISKGLDYDLMSDLEKLEFKTAYLKLHEPPTEAGQGQPVQVLTDDQIRQYLPSQYRGILGRSMLKKDSKVWKYAEAKALASLYGSNITGYTSERLSTELYPIAGKTQSGYVHEISIPVEPIDVDWEISVTNVTRALTPAEQKYSARSAALDSIAAITENERAFPKTVICQIIAQATDRFSSIPDFYGDFYGLMVEVPTNYNPFTREYAGVWTGTYKMAWTNNPVWICREFIMNNDWGIKSKQLNIQINNANFYEAAKYCDFKVPDFDGGLSPRHTFNEILGEKREIREYLHHMAGSFHGQLKENNGLYNIYIDRPKVPKFFVSDKTVAVTGFSFSRSDLSTQYNFMRVTYPSKEMNYEEDRRLILDNASIAKHGVIEFNFQATGVTNRTEAIRQGAYMMLTNRDENIFANFQVTRLGHLIDIYDTFYIVEPKLNWGLGLRIESYDPVKGWIYLRDPIAISGATPFELSYHNQTGITKISVENTDPYILKIQGSFEHPWLVEDAPIMLEGGSYGYAKVFRTLGAKQGSSEGAGEVFDISAAIVSTGKYEALDQITTTGSVDLDFDSESTAVINEEPPSKVFNISVEYKNLTSGISDPVYYVRFNASERAKSYKVTWFDNNSNAQHSTVLYTNGGELSPIFLNDSTITIAITPVSASGLTGVTSYLSNVNPAVSNQYSSKMPDLISSEVVGDYLVFTWGSEPLDMFEYSNMYVTYNGPGGSSDLTEIPKASTSYSIPYVGAGDYFLQVSYLIQGNSIFKVLNDIWTMVGTTEVSVATPIINSIVSKVTNYAGTTASAGSGYFRIGVTIPDGATNPFLKDNFEPVVVEYETGVGTNVYVARAGSVYTIKPSLTFVSLETISQQPTGAKVRVRTQGRKGDNPSVWVYATMPEREDYVPPPPEEP